MRRKVEETTASRRARRSFTPSFKAEVVALVRQGDRTLPAICREMDLSETAVRRWVQQAAVDAGERDGLTSDEREELRRLRREVRVLRDERDILKRAATFFGVRRRQRPVVVVLTLKRPVVVVLALVQRLGAAHLSRVCPPMRLLQHGGARIVEPHAPGVGDHRDVAPRADRGPG